MSEWSLSIVMIVPASKRDKANLVSCALGHDVMPGKTFSVALSFNGMSPVTHYACRTAAKQDFLSTVSLAQTGTLPLIDWEEYGLEEADVTDVLDDLILDVDTVENTTQHFIEAIGDNGLQRVMLNG